MMTGQRTHNLHLLFLLSFLLAVSFSFPLYIQSTFLEFFVPLSQIGWFYLAANAVTMVALNSYSWFITRLSNYRMAVATLLLYGGSIFGLLLATRPIEALAAFVVFTVSQNLLMINFDLFVERFTRNAVTGRIRTTYQTFLNFGTLISPLLVGRLIGVGEHYRLVLFFALVLIIPVLITLLAQRRALQEHIQYRHHHFFETLKHFSQHPELKDIFGVAVLLQLFYSIAVVYMPIYLHQVIGFDWPTIGILFTIMLVPFIFLEIPAGIAADRTGERGLLGLGFVILAASVLLFAFIRSANPLVWALVLFLSRCGAALVEAMRETYFFKTVSVKDVDYINLFRNAIPLGHMIGPALAVLCLEYAQLSMPYVFLILGLLLMFGLFFTIRLPELGRRKA